MPECQARASYVPGTGTQDDDAGGSGPPLHRGRPAGDDPERRRGPAGEAGQGAVEAGDGADFVHIGRADDGLHFEDVRKLLAVLHALVGQGNSVVVIEHNLEVIKTADWVLDLGPEGGDKEGEIVAEGTPEHVAKEPRSYTGDISSSCSTVPAPSPRSRGRRKRAQPQCGSERSLDKHVPITARIDSLFLRLVHGRGQLKGSGSLQRSGNLRESLLSGRVRAKLPLRVY